MAHGTMYFPPDFLWGTATASHHVEGNNLNNDWWAWEQGGHCVEGQTSGLACNWWDFEAFLQDIDVAADMGTRAHRLSVEWSRIEPEPSVFDAAALEQYRAMLEALVARDIEPMVTLHHYSNPLWLVEKGDFQSDIVVEYFERFTRKVVSSFGDLVPKWITINEPIAYFYQRHLAKVFPQPKEPSGWRQGLRGVRNMLRCHAAAYETIKELQPEGLVSVAKNVPLFDPMRSGSRLDSWWAQRFHWAYNDVWMGAMVNGRLNRLLGGGRIAGLADSFDFVALNYYTRLYAHFGRMPKQEWPDDVLVSDANYGEIYPEGIYRAIKYGLQFNKPIYITENGVADRQDQYRASFLIEHLREVWRAVSFNFPVMGYYHWSLIDNFEWDRGWTQRFGLIELDPESQARTLRPSAELYKQICTSNSLSSRMVEQHAIDLMPQIFPDPPLRSDILS